MATKAELENELAQLRRQMNERPEPDPTAAGQDWENAVPPDAEAGGAGNSAIDRLLDEHGVSPDDIRNLMDQLDDELGQLPQNKPVLTALGAFAIGFILGRMSR